MVREHPSPPQSVIIVPDDTAGYSSIPSDGSGVRQRFGPWNTSSPAAARTHTQREREREKGINVTPHTAIIMPKAPRRWRHFDTHYYEVVLDNPHTMIQRLALTPRIAEGGGPPPPSPAPNVQEDEALPDRIGAAPLGVQPPGSGLQFVSEVQQHGRRLPSMPPFWERHRYPPNARRAPRGGRRRRPPAARSNAPPASGTASASPPTARAS